MATIKDIAKLAGVSQGTVSNVLNGRGIVSSDKIRLVLSACEQLGYIPNERAKILRKGQTKTLGILAHTLHLKRYMDFYLSFNAYAQSHGYTVNTYLADADSLEAEKIAFARARSDMVAGLAIFSDYLSSSPWRPFQDELMQLLFIERRPPYESSYIGFDYKKAGKELAAKAIEKGYTNICLLTDKLGLSYTDDFSQGFAEQMENRLCKVTSVHTDDQSKYRHTLQSLDLSQVQAVFASGLDYAQTAKQIFATFSSAPLPDIYTVSPLFTLPEADFIKYEMNYRLLGNMAAKKLVSQIEKKTAPETRVLDNAGFRSWFPGGTVQKASSRPLNVLTLDSPTARTMINISRIYTKHTGIPINVTIYSYDEMYEAFNSLREDSVFDVLRLDVTWLSWFAGKILRPLEEIEPSVKDDIKNFLSGTAERYAYTGGKLYALPNTPSTQILYYRQDLFNNPMYKRMYRETNKRELRVPESFEEFNCIAAFFTRKLNPSSPVEYGTTLTLGSTGVAGSEYLARLLSLQDHLFGSDGVICLNNENAVKALRLLEEVKRYTNATFCPWWTDTASAFSQGDVAMSILYNNFASPLLRHGSKVVGKIGCAMVPGGNPIIGGGTLGVSRYSKQPEEALRFIRWVCSEPVASASAMLGGVSPCKQSYNNYEIINNFPWLKLTKSCFDAARGRRLPPEREAPFDERRFISIIGIAVKNVHSGALQPQEAMDYAQRLFEEQFAYIMPRTSW